MIDFRYHLVSLISVFLALAVGIALGAGPLKETIGDTLTGQVQQLRGEKDDLRTQLDDANADLARASTYVEATAARMLPGTLTDRRVAVIALGDVPDKTEKAIEERLTQAGASVSAQVTLDAAWTDPAQRAYRQALTTRLVSHLQEQVDPTATADQQLAAALVQGVAGADPANPDALSGDAQAILDILASKEGGTPLISVKDAVTTPADAVVVLGVPIGQSSDGSASPSPAVTPETTATQLAILSAAQQYSAGAVLADGARGTGSLTDAVLADDTLAATLSTVSSTDEVAGQVSVPLALAARLAGTAGHFGLGSGETPLPPAVELPPVDRTPQPPQETGPQAPTGAPTDAATAGSQG